MVCTLRVAGFCFRPALVPSIVFMVLFPLLISLGLWQMDRAGEKEALLVDQESRAGQPPLDLNAGLVIGESDRFRPAQAEGRFVPSRQWLLDNRVLEGRPGYHVFTLFELAGDKGHLLVNRGWVALGESREFLPDLPLPEGALRLRGRLNTPASVGIRLGDAALDSIARKVVVPSLDIAALAEATRLELPRYALVLDADQPGALTYDWIQRAQITPEKHLGYAVQWFALATALLVIFLGVNTRREKMEATRDE